MCFPPNPHTHLPQKTYHMFMLYRCPSPSPSPLDAHQTPMHPIQTPQHIGQVSYSHYTASYSQHRYKRLSGTEAPVLLSLI